MFGRLSVQLSGRFWGMGGGGQKGRGGQWPPRDALVKPQVEPRVAWSGRLVSEGTLKRPLLRG